MASILVRARQVAFVGGAQRRPDEPPFVLNERSFNPDVFERVADEVPAKAKAKAKPTQPDGVNAATDLGVDSVI